MSVELFGFDLSLRFYRFRYFYVIVQRWTSDKSMDKLRNTPENDLKHFDNSSNGKDAYIAMKDDNYGNGDDIVIGKDSTKPVTTRKKRSITYRNAPLNEDTEYAVFIRVFYDDTGVSSGASCSGPCSIC